MERQATDHTDPLPKESIVVFYRAQNFSRSIEYFYKLDSKLEDMQEDIRKEDVERYISNLVEFGQKEESSLYKKSFIEHLKYLARRILRL